MAWEAWAALVGKEDRHGGSLVMASVVVGEEEGAEAWGAQFGRISANTRESNESHRLFAFESTVFTYRVAAIRTSKGTTRDALLTVILGNRVSPATNAASASLTRDGTRGAESHRIRNLSIVKVTRAIQRLTMAGRIALQAKD